MGLTFSYARYSRRQHGCQMRFGMSDWLRLTESRCKPPSCASTRLICTSSPTTRSLTISWLRFSAPSSAICSALGIGGTFPRLPRRLWLLAPDNLHLSQVQAFLVPFKPGMPRQAVWHNIEHSTRIFLFQLHTKRNRKTPLYSRNSLSCCACQQWITRGRRGRRETQRFPS